MKTVRQNYEQVQTKIRQACARAGRNPQEVQVVAVTKYVDLETTKETLDAGILHIGESKVQDGIPKWKELGDRGTWHFIGHLQRKKSKDVVGRFRYLHSLDRLSLADELERRLEVIGDELNVFIQVNISGEETKYGISPKELEDFVQAMSKYKFIKPIGLMTMAPHTENQSLIREIFQELKYRQVQIQNTVLPTLSELSMGMSQDYEIAVEEGATFVRLGSTLTGGRP
ncbi:YggS family pyridoxal phosphate-dependent enzyme [Risungbinella massiliensis]|uniref:YggS family pyridoxal phosphate-dependent enzyme n=1 Tax=Risungbinella massiliensis TaxID=1329796 RepID=UPI0005CBF437|nr:YggS family pyridoxal phosphate-dependent enzyme [Risungbinella massiliensis]